MIVISTTLTRPLVTALPNAIPPIARNTVVHLNESKSSYAKKIISLARQQVSMTFLKTPVEKNATIGKIAMTPISLTKGHMNASS